MGEELDRLVFVNHSRLACYVLSCRCFVYKAHKRRADSELFIEISAMYTCAFYLFNEQFIEISACMYAFYSFSVQFIEISAYVYVFDLFK